MSNKRITKQQKREALAALHRLQRAYCEDIPYDVFKERVSLRKDVIGALFLLTDMVYGDPAPGEACSSLCDICHMARALSPFPQNAPRDKHGVRLLVCLSCYQQFQQQEVSP